MIPAPSGSHLKCLKKLMGKHFIDPKSSEILSSFSLYDANCPFLAKTAPCPFP
jgi:hypothetical protein